MALRSILLQKRIEDKKKTQRKLKKELEALRGKTVGFKAQERKLREALEEVTEDTPAEDRKAIEEAVEEHDEAIQEHNSQIAELEEKIQQISQDISQMDDELKELEDNAENAIIGDPIPDTQFSRTRERMEPMQYRTKFFGMNLQERNAFFANNEVKEFLRRVRQIGHEKRAVKGAELTIPEVMLSLLRENIENYSKLLRHINLKTIRGTARQPIMGTIPEAVWTEMRGVLNELDLEFNQVVFDGYKVGGFFALHNSDLEDSDENLASAVMTALGQAIGYALDKAILYGKGSNSKMPLGIVTDLASTVQPSDYPDDGPAWTDLSMSNIVKMDSTLTEAKFYSQFVLNASIPKHKYSNGERFWAMNEQTYSLILSKSVMANMAGAFVSSVGMTMPIIGGDIVLLDFIPDGDIIGGYGDMYTLVQRSEIELAQSEHYRFIQDQTVFKGTARYDGRPVMRNSFVVINIKNTAPTTSLTFAEDKANKADEPIKASETSREL